MSTPQRNLLSRIVASSTGRGARGLNRNADGIRTSTLRALFAKGYAAVRTQNIRFGGTASYVVPTPAGRAVLA